MQFMHSDLEEYFLINSKKTYSTKYNNLQREQEHLTMMEKQCQSFM